MREDPKSEGVVFELCGTEKVFTVSFEQYMLENSDFVRACVGYLKREMNECGVDIALFDFDSCRKFGPKRELIVFKNSASDVDKFHDAVDKMQQEEDRFPGFWIHNLRDAFGSLVDRESDACSGEKRKISEQVEEVEEVDAEERKEKEGDEGEKEHQTNLKKAKKQ